MVKDLLRRELKATRDEIPLSECASYSAELTALIRSMPEYASASLILLYYPIGSEPDLLSLAAYAANDGIPVAFPVIRNGEMAFCVPDNASAFCAGTMGIPEPVGTELTDVAETADAICVVPALAVDKRGFRIGYGGGYYDRFLSRFSGFSVCAVFPQLFVDEIPTEAHDSPVAAAAVAGAGITRFR